MLRFLFVFLLALAGTQALPNGFGDKRGVVEVTVISESQANRLFEEFVSHKEIPFEFPLDGCYARATAMARIAESQKIEMGKIYADGILRTKTDIKEMPEVTWGYHVAPTLWVQKDGKPVLMVFDPSMFKKPVTVAEWTDAMKLPGIPNAQVKNIYYGSRFQLGPREAEDKKNSWLRDDLAMTDEVLKTYKNVDLVGFIKAAAEAQQDQRQQTPAAGVR